MATAPATGDGQMLQERSTGALLSDISNDVLALVRQEAELAKGEITEAIRASLVVLVVAMVAGVLGIMALLFAGFAAAWALSYVVPLWAAFLTVSGATGAVVLCTSPVLLGAARHPVRKPAETLRTAKADIEWAKDRLRR